MTLATAPLLWRFNSSRATGIVRAASGRGPSRRTMLHLTKLAVGVRDIDHLRELQAERAVRSPPLRHRTRSFPRRHQEVIDGGSMYWVISGSMLVRQRIVDIVEDRRDDGSRVHRPVAGSEAGAADRQAHQAIPGVALPAPRRGAARPGPRQARQGRGCVAADAAARIAGALPAVKPLARICQVIRYSHQSIKPAFSTVL